MEEAEYLEAGAQHYLLTRFTGYRCSIQTSTWESCLLAAGSYGGHISIAHETSGKACVVVLSSLGQLLDSCTVELDGDHIIKHFWDANDGMFVITTAGRVVQWNGCPSNPSEFVLHSSGTGDVIIEAQYEDGHLVALTGTNEFLWKGFLASSSSVYYARPDFLEFSSPQCWTLILPAISHPNSSPSIVFGHQSSVHVLSIDGLLLSKSLSYGCILHVAARKHICVLTLDGRLVVLTADLERAVLDMDTMGFFDPMSVDSLRWLDDSTIVLKQDSLNALHLVQIDGTHLRVPIDKGTRIVESLDGIRLLSIDSHRRISKLPKHLADIEGLVSEDSKLGELLHTQLASLPDNDLLEGLELASRALISVYPRAEHLARLQSLIKQGMAILRDRLVPDDNSQHTLVYIDATIMGHSAQIGALQRLQRHFALTGEELASMPKDLLLRRLYMRDQHFEAMEVALALDLDLSALISDWILKLIKTTSDAEQEQWDKISEKLQTWSYRATSIDYTQLAEAAIRARKLKTARKLLKLEKDARRKLGLLVLLDDYVEALIEAVQTGNPDEVKYVLDHLKQRLGLSEFLQLADISPKVARCIRTYCTEHEPVLMKLLAYQDDRLEELLSEFSTNDSDAAVSDGLALLDQWFRLLRAQRSTEKRTGQRLLGKTKMDTFNLLMDQSGLLVARDFLECSELNFKRG